MQSLSISQKPAPNFYQTHRELFPDWVDPVHLKPVFDMFQRAYTEGGVFGCVSYPPQVGKSTVALACLAGWLRARPEANLLYASYSDTITKSKSKLARNYYRDLGCEPNASDFSANRWGTLQGGAVIAQSLQGAITGLPGLELVVIDDSLKGWSDAMSPTVRETQYQNFKANVYSRRHPKTSIIVIATRWHSQDLIGRLGSEGWEVINVPAMPNPCPDLRTDEFWEDVKQNQPDAIWESLYMGRPIDERLNVFKGLYRTDKLHPRYDSVGVGFDLAYSTKTTADRTAVVVLGRTAPGEYTILYADAQRTADYDDMLLDLQKQYKGSWLWYKSGTESGAAKLLKSKGLAFRAADAASKDKLSRAVPVSAAWNSGKILLPRDEAGWESDFLQELHGFTGGGGGHDDYVDALAAAYDAIHDGTAGRSEALRSWMSKIH